MRRWLGAATLRLLGWTSEEGDPVPNRCVIVAAPHTSNWDFFYLILFAWRFGVQLFFVGKHTLFKGPMGPVMRAFGGVPVNRSRRDGLVGQLANALNESPRMGLVFPAEGSRGWRPHWKSGFYRVAQVAGVPISLSFLDYEAKTGGFGPCFVPGTDMKADMDIARSFYVDKRGRHPQLFGPVQLEEEAVALEPWRSAVAD
ncbi:MAG: hypothetical protein CL910_05750 [Deltaproteobacteria bacterium]|nr:hypothetical protein [Deltaproteobacteria bacterium]